MSRRNKLITALLSIVLCFSIFTVTAYAVDLDGDGIDDEVVVTEPPYVEPETEPPYVEPETEAPATEYVQPETEAQGQDETQYQNQYVETQAPDSTEFQAPTIAKTVSEKKYSTSYTAGIVSWICVGLGVVAIAVVMISTKVGARKRIR